MTYRPAIGGRLAAELGIAPTDTPYIQCDGCGVIKLAVTIAGGPPQWLLNRTAPRGWSLVRTEHEDGRVIREDRCPGCRG